MIISCLCLSACGGDDDEPNVKFQDITLSCDQSYTIQNGAGTTWTSSNELIASVSGNIVNAERVGEATISSSKGSFKVTVKGTVTAVYKVPCIEWGASKSTVKNFMKGSVLDKETTNEISYNGTGAQLLTMYSFNNNALVSSGVALNGSYINSDQLVDFMLENYVPISVDKTNYLFYFVTPDNKSVVGLQLKASGHTIIYLVMYIPRTESKSTQYFQDSEWSKHNIMDDSNLDNVYKSK